MMHGVFKAKHIVRTSVHPLKSMTRRSQRTIDEKAQRESMVIERLDRGLVLLMVRLDEVIIGLVKTFWNGQRRARVRKRDSSHENEAQQ
jgi:hypothetical protein